MIFSLDGNVKELEKPAQYPYSPDVVMVQAKESSASCAIHVEDFGVQTNSYTFVFENSSQEDYETILEWFVNTAQGMMNAFNLTDDLGVTRLVRFTEPRLAFSLNQYKLWNGSFRVEEVV